MDERRVGSFLDTPSFEQRRRDPGGEKRLRRLQSGECEGVQVIYLVCFSATVALLGNESTANLAEYKFTLAATVLQDVRAEMQNLHMG
jgi:hypothetical protein